MRKNNIDRMGIFAVLLIFGLVFVGCNKSSSDISGVWTGNIGGLNVEITVTKVGWSITAPGFTDTGSYARDGNTARLTSDNIGRVIGTGELVNKNLLKLVLNQASIAPGTYELKRK